VRFCDGEFNLNELSNLRYILFDKLRLVWDSDPLLITIINMVIPFFSGPCY